MSKERYYLFSNGTECMQWQAWNCEKCVKAVFYDEKKGRWPKYRCAVQKHIEEAAITDGMGNKRDYDATRSYCPYKQTERKRKIKKDPNQLMLDLGNEEEKRIVMKVFGCKCDMDYGGGIILVAANNVEEAFLTSAMDEKVSYMFDWADDNGIWCEPDGNINHCWSSVYPFKKWIEVEHISTDLTKPQVIFEDCYYE